ncbi:hypothetical protein AKO1_001081 [Acrasis kona]|uniref:Uncharacterized protein n=1 Tax=Acrasis kona TaxID=1008807 RepID=A0AAW2ZEZ0_9EUKA
MEQPHEWLRNPCRENVDLMLQDAQKITKRISDSLVNVGIIQKHENLVHCEDRLEDMQVMIRDVVSKIDGFSGGYHDNFFSFIRLFFVDPPKDASELKNRILKNHKDSDRCGGCGGQVWPMNRHTCRCCKVTLCSWNSCAGSRVFSEVNKHPDNINKNFEVLLCEDCACNSYERAYAYMLKLDKLILDIDGFCDVIDEILQGTSHNSEVVVDVDAKKEELEFKWKLVSADKDFEYYQADSDFGAKTPSSPSN